MTNKEKAEALKKERDSLIQLRDFIMEYNNFAATGKLLSTYTHYPTWPDGRVHPSMVISGTSTGRLACRGPNLQLRAA